MLNSIQVLIVTLALLALATIVFAYFWSRRNPTVRAAKSVFRERIRQVRVQGYDSLWDDLYTAGELARAASEYAAAAATGGDNASVVCGAPRPEWPWGGEHWKPKGRRDCLVKAGALIIAELERLERIEGRS